MTQDLRDAGTFPSHEAVGERYGQEWWRRIVGEGVLEWYSEEWGVGNIVSRQVDGGWEYAFVRWRYTVPHLSFILRGGRKYDEDGKEIP